MFRVRSQPWLSESTMAATSWVVTRTRAADSMATCGRLDNQNPTATAFTRSLFHPKRQIINTPPKPERKTMNHKFDELTKSIAQSVSRRAALKKFGVGLAGAALACFLTISRSPASADDARSTNAAAIRA